MPGLSKVIVLDPDERAGQQVQLGFEREGIPTAAAMAGATAAEAVLDSAGADTGLIVVGGADGVGLDLVRRARHWLDEHRVDAPVMFAGRGATWDDATSAGADEIVRHPAYLRDVVTIGRLLRGSLAGRRDHIVGDLLDVTGAFTLVRALAALGRSATLTLVRGLRRGEVRFYLGEVTSAQVGVSHGQAALHQLLLWTDARFDFHHEDVVRRQQIPLSHHELFADAERFLEGVRGSSGGLSPAMVLEQDLPRVQSFAKQIPTEVYGVLRMFDGHRALADVLEDSPYRVFETLRVAQRAVDAGLLRVGPEQPRRPRWRTILEIENWLVGGEPRKLGADINGARPSTLRDARGAPAVVGSEPSRGKKRKKRKKRGDTLPALPAATASPEIDWGALVPRIVGAEVGPLAGVVPASGVSGEIVTPSRSTSDARTRARAGSAPLVPEPTVVFDEAQVAPAVAAPPPAAPPPAAPPPAAPPSGAPTERLPIAGPAGEADRAAGDAAPVANDATGTDTKPITTAAAARADAEDAASEALEAETVRLTMRPPRAARAATQRAAVDISDLFDDDDLDVAPANAAPASAAPASTAPAGAAPMAPSITAELSADPTAEPLAASVSAEPGTDISAEAITAESTSAEPVRVEPVSVDDADSTVTTRAAPADAAAANQHPAVDADPTVTTAAAPAADDTANTRAAPADGDAGTTRAAPVAAGDSVAVKRRAASEPARIVDDLDLGDTKPERPGAIEDAAEPQTGKLDLAALAAAAVVQDHVVAVASDAITAPIAASLGATAEPSGRVPQDAAPRLPDSLVGDSTPSEIEDDPSDGVVRHHIATAETAPVKRRPPSADPVDDRPGDTTGEITMPRQRPQVRIRYSEPSILVADLGLEETDDDEAATPDPDAQPSGPAVASPAVASPAVSSPAVASPAVASPAVASPAVASPASTPPASTPPAGTPAAAPAAAAASGAAATARASGSFTATEEAFFDAGRDRDSGVQPAIHESFDDLDEDYRPVGFWERLRGRLNPHGKPQK